MPIISSFYGISIRMFLQDHNPPHFHAFYGEYEARIAIATGEVRDGHLPTQRGSSENGLWSSGQH